MPKKYPNTANNQRVNAQNQPYTRVWQAIDEKKFIQGLKLLQTIPKDNQAKWFPAQARCLFGLKRYDEAIRIYQDMRGWRTNRTSLLGIARCYQEQGLHELALKTMKQIPNWKTDKDLLVNLACLLEAAKKYKKAIQFFKRIPNWEHDKRARLGLGYCYEGIGDFEQARVQFENAPNLANDKESLLCLGYCHQKMGNYELAISTFKRIRNWRHDKQALLGIAFCNQHMGSYEEAVDTLNEIGATDVDAAIALARRLEDERNYNKALETLLNVPSNERTNAFYISLARCYEEMGNYPEALAAYEQIPNLDYESDALLGLAICHELMGNFSKALTFFDKLLNLKRDQNTLLGLARCYEKMGDYAQALGIYDELLSWRSNKTTLLSLARCYEAMGLFDEALNSYKKINHWNLDKQVLLGLAICHELMGDYDEAHKYYQHINNFENDNEVSLSRAHCYQAMGNYDKALEIIDTIPASERTTPVYIFYARCLADMLNFPAALQAYKQILNWENDRQVLQHLAICKADMGHFDKAITIFHKIPHWQIDKTILISLAHAFVKMGDYNQALATYQQIAYWETDKKALLSIGRCYEKMGEYTKALETYQSIPNWENDKQALLSIAVCNGLMSNPQTNFLFESLTDRFPYFIRGYEDYCRILVENEEIQALGTIEATLKKFPYLQSLYLLKARIHENNRDSKQMFATLMETIQQFPYYPDAYLSLIRYYLIIRNEEAAQRIVDDCYERFPGAQKLFMRIEKLQNMPPRLLMLSYVEDISPLDNRKIPHPEPIRELYSFLKEIPGKHVLCGGVVMQAILQQAKARPIKTSDKDIVSTCTDENALIKKGFWKSKKRPHLYTLKKEGHSIDFTTVPDATNWMDKDVRKRDFTIAALFWDEDETISDPSGLGIPDLLGNVLRMIGNPGIRLKEDATRLLRAAKFMLLGFEPEANLVTALEDWQPTDALNWEHLYALARKHLYHLDRRAYVRALQSYGLLEKLFGIPYHDNVNEALWTLETFLNLDHSFAEEQPSSLISEEADLLSLKQQVQRNPRLADVVVERSELEVKGSCIDGLDLASANPDFHPIGQQPTTEVETPKHPSSVDTQIPINPPASRALSPTMHDHKSSALNAIKTDCKPSLSQATEQKTKPKSTVSGSKQGFFQPAAESLSDFNHPNETDSPESKVPSSKRLSKKRRTALRTHSKASEVMDIPYDCYDSGQAETIPKCTLF